VHAEFRINDKGVWPLEVAPRPIGGLCARSLRFGEARDEVLISLEELLIRHALDLPGPDLLRESGASGVMMIPVPHSGVLQGVSGEESAQSIPGITDLMITARLHDTLLAWPEGSSYLGFLFARGDSPEFVERALREAHQKLTFKIASKLPVEHPATHRMSN
jgi:L-aminoacid ligase-like protein